MTDGRERDGNKKRNIILPMVIIITFTLVFQFPFLSIGAPADGENDTKGLVGEDFIISFDNDQTALHPSIAITPTNGFTKERGVSGWTHAVWDEYSIDTGYREIFYSMSRDSGANWTGEVKDIFISDPRQEKQSFGDAVNPSITVDSYGIIHVVWAEHYAYDNTWEIHHSHSLDETGEKWSSIESKDTLVSYIDVKYPNAQVMSPPKIVAGVVPGEVGDNMLHVTWSEYEPERRLQEVYYSSSSDGGNTWSSVEQEMNIPVSMPSEQGAGDAYDPVISTSGNSAEFVHVAWTQKKVGAFETVYYLNSDDQGKTWIPEMEDTITPFIPEKMLVSDLSMTAFFEDIHMVWSQMPEGKASDTGIFYSGSSKNGAQDSWTSQKEEFIVPINNDDGNMPIDPSIAVDDKQQVHVFWSELDDKSPRGTQEIHTSFNSKPLDDPGAWTGQELDIVISASDSDITANVNNVSVAMNMLPDGSWRPRVVWDELNNDPIKAEGNYEIHTIPEWTLSVSTDGSGTVTQDPLQDTYTDGDTVTLTANPGAGWSFDHWSGNITGSTNPRTITMDWNKVVTAYFTEDQYTLAISVVGGGTVSKNPNLATYTYGTSVELTATPDFGWEFDQWTGDLATTTNPDSLTIYGNSAVTCYFTEITHDIALTSGWNMISIPLEQADTSISTVLTSINGNYDVVKYYDATDQDDPWKTYRVGATTNDLSNIDHTMAFWLHTTTACTLTAYGEYRDLTNITLYTGWNFVGYPTEDTTKTITQALTGTNYDMIEGYDGDDPYLLRTMAGTETMMPGAGYWVRVPSDTVWTVNW